MAIGSKRRPKKWTDKQRYVVAVLFLRGYSFADIAALMKRHGLARMTRQTVAGIIQRTPFRASMPREEKNRWLAKLKTQRMDGGILGEEVFRAL